MPKMYATDAEAETIRVLHLIVVIGRLWLGNRPVPKGRGSRAMLKKCVDTAQGALDKVRKMSVTRKEVEL